MDETIAAIATAYGEGGIGIVRISGEKALPILEEIFEFAGEHNEIISRRMSYGRIVDREEGRLIDECMAVYMKAPRTYTTEDIVEINCHGSMISLKNTLDLVLKKGARLAEPGEFTKRAFLNGRIDLSQAEAVMDLISARTDRSFDIAASQLEGQLSLRIRKIRSALLDLLVNITVNLDYPDEDIEELTLQSVGDEVSLIGDMIEKLMATADSGRMIREGLRVVITGRPNVGKSSLMNGLLRENRAIVTNVPGTTRDTIEEAMNLRGIPVYLVDTAGIHDTEDQVEKLGIERSKDAFNQADLIILVLDSSDDLTEDDLLLLEHIGNRRCLVLLNKQDIGNRIDAALIRSRLPQCDLIETAVTDGRGLTEVEDRIEALVMGGELKQESSVMVNNVRHIDLLRQALEDLRRAEQMAAASEPLDLIEVDVRSAYDALGEIIGETVSDTVLDEVFSRFCLGK